MQTLVTHINGIDTDTIRGLIGTVADRPEEGRARFQVTTRWQGGTRSETRVEEWGLGGRRHAKDFTLHADEPVELAGTNTAPNPQEILMTGLNACMLVGYTAVCAMKGIELTHLEIETAGELDIRGFLGLDPDVKPGYDEVRYTVRIAGSGTREQFQEVHEAVMATSPNFWNFANPIRLRPSLVVE